MKKQIQFTIEFTPLTALLRGVIFSSLSLTSRSPSSWLFSSQRTVQIGMKSIFHLKFFCLVWLLTCQIKTYAIEASMSNPSLVAPLQSRSAPAPDSPGPIPPRFSSPSQFLSNRSVEIEWDEVPGAIQYDLEIYDGKYKKFIKMFSSKSNIFKLNVKMGKYFFRSRILDKFARSSEWTEMAELLIAPPPAKIKKNKVEKQQLFAEKGAGHFNYPISWEELPGISEYKVVLETPDGHQEVEAIVKGTSTTLKVPAGQHQIRVRAILSDGTLGDLSEPTSVISVLGAKIQKPTITYRQDPKLGSVALLSSELAIAQFDGDLYYMPLEGTTWKKVKEFHDLKTKQIIFNANYIPGQYQLRIQAKSKGFTPSEFGITEFVIKPREVVITPIPQETITLTQ